MTPAEVFSWHARFALRTDNTAVVLKLVVPRRSIALAAMNNSGECGGAARYLERTWRREASSSSDVPFPCHLEARGKWTTRAGPNL